MIFISHLTEGWIGVKTPEPEIRQVSRQSLHALLILHGFPPLRHSGTIRNEAVAHYLPQWGVQTTVLTDEPAREIDTSNSLDIMRDQTWDDQAQGYKIRRLPWKIGQRTSGWRRNLRRLPLGASGVLRSERREFLSRMLPQSEQAVDLSQIDVIYGSAAPVEAVLLAVQLGRRHNKPTVVDLRDPWSYQPAGVTRHVLDFFIERRTERRTLAAADAVVVTTEATAELLTRKLGLPRRHIHVIPNGYDERDFVDEVSGVPPADRFVVTHAGQLNPGHDKPATWRAGVKRRLGFDVSPLKTDFQSRSPKYILAAAAEFLTEHPDARQRLLIQFVGLTDPLVYPAINEFPYPDCLRIVERVAPEAAVKACRDSHLLLLMQNRYFLDGHEFCVAIPAKLYTYLRTGRRILACVQDSEISKLLAETGAGMSVPPTDVAAIKAALASEFYDWASGRRHRSSQQISRFDRRALTQQLAELFFCAKRR